ncbi:MAG: metalloregulator ArsR/SmtB family transcription factor [Actinomycetota bacterium]
MTPATDPWAALGDPTRRQVLRLVGSGTRSVTEIAAELPVSRPAVSQHLRILADAGLVDAQPDGRRRVYRVREQGLVRLRSELHQFWTTTLDNLKEVAEHDDRDGDTT